MSVAEPEKSRRSIYVDLGTIIVLVVVTVMLFHSAHLYVAKREAAIDAMKASAVRSVATLEKNVVGFIESYAPSEYEKLVANELERTRILAIIVEDRKMGEVLGEEVYVSGKIREAGGGVIDYEPSDIEHFDRLEQSYFLHRDDIRSPEGEVVGSITIYMSGDELVEELNDILRRSAVDALGISLALVVLLFLSIRMHLLRPLSNIVKVISVSDADGIPVERLPHQGPREIVTLSSRINDMIGTIDDSRGALREAKEQMELALWGSGDGWWDWDVVRGRAHFDARWTAMIGYRQDEVEGSFEGWKALIHPEDLEQVMATLQTHLDGSSPDYEVGFRMRTKAGAWKWILARGKVVARDESGRPLRMVGTHSDIDGAKRNEQALSEAKAEAERASRAKGEFLANMSHEIRTPMNAILGMTELLAERELDEEARHFVSIARAAGGTLLSIINDILDLSKIEAGQLRLEEEPFDLTELIASTTAMVGLRARERGLTIDYDMEGAVPLWVSGDSLRLRQVLLNLLGNAVKFTERGGVRLTVAVEEGADGMVEFHVEDSGIGIPADRLEEIFESFSQAELSITRRYGGTGLGLAISRRLVEMMGGEISVESEPGRGSTFHFSAHLPAASPVSAEAHKEVEAVTGPLRILVAEDAEDNRLLLRAYLKGSGHALVFAENGLEAVERFQEGAFELVLMDVQMPEMDGLTATRTIREWEREQGVEPTPIVALTAYALKEEIDRVLSAGCDRHLAKPVRKKALLEAIALNAKPRG